MVKERPLLCRWFLWLLGCLCYGGCTLTSIISMISMISMTKNGAACEARDDQCDWNIMTSMTGSEYAVMCNLINTHTHVS